MKALFGIFFLIWLVSIAFQKLPTIWAYIVAILEYIGESINATPASAATDDDDDSPGITSVFNDDYTCAFCNNSICTCHEINTCFTCGSSICSCHTGMPDDPYRSDDSLFSDSSTSMFDD